MARSLSAALLSEIYAQESNDPFLTLLTISHSSISDILLVNNTVDIVSRGNTYTAFPMRIRLSPDDGENAPRFGVVLDNVSREFIDEFRSITGVIDVTMEMVLASAPDTVQMSFTELKVQTITYNAKQISISLYIDSMLYTELTCEKYTPSNFPGIF